MNVGEAIKLHHMLRGVVDGLEETIVVAGNAEAFWAEYGDGMIGQLWTNEQRQAFANIKAWTETIVIGLLNKEVGA